MQQTGTDGIQEQAWLVGEGDSPGIMQETEVWLTSQLVNFAVPADNRIKVKESEKPNKYLDLAKELKRLWNMNVTEIPILVGAFGTILKDLEKILGNLENWRKIKIV